MASDKARGILGKADLDMAQFGYTEYREHRLEIKDSQYEGAWIEVALKATERRDSTRNAAGSSLNESYRSSNTNVEPVAAAESQNMTQANYNELL